MCVRVEVCVCVCLKSMLVCLGACVRAVYIRVEGYISGCVCLFVYAGRDGLDKDIPKAITLRATDQR